MDPLSQGVVGATFSQSFVRERRQAVVAGVVGFLSGMAADLDILITSQTDPLLYLEYHRQFTHSLVFIPIGAAICAVLFHFVAFRRTSNFKDVFWFSLLGYGSHGLLDACTTYGTQLFWPFSDLRVAWNVVSIIDPLFTLPILGLIAATFRTRRPIFARIAFGFAIGYMLLGFVQRERAEAAGWELARSRGHEPARLEAKPSFGNIVLWKVVYETSDAFFVDAVHVFVHRHIFAGQSAAKPDPGRDFPWLKESDRQWRDIERFRWFSNGYIAVDPNDPRFLIDVRYSMVPNEIRPLWGIRLNPETPDRHVAFEMGRDVSPRVRSKFFRMLLAQPEVDAL